VCVHGHCVRDISVPVHGDMGWGVKCGLRRVHVHRHACGVGECLCMCLGARVHACVRVGAAVSGHAYGVRMTGAEHTTSVRVCSWICTCTLDVQNMAQSND
jgi:hypothetical protein